VATAFDMSKGDIVVLIDSDTLIHHNAISEIIKCFNNNEKVGAIVGHVKVLNAKKNLLTKIQDTWYDHAFNCVKAAESVYGSVLVCSGCLAAYRREAIADFMPYWSASQYHYSDDRELTWFANAPKAGKRHLIKSIKSKFLRYASAFDDADDRILTAHSLEKRWQSTYVSTAFAYTDAPEDVRTYYKQQVRWKKGCLRTNFYAIWFFWQRHAIMAFLYYFEVLGMFFSPLITTGILVYEIAVVHEMWYPIYFFALLGWRGLMYGLDYRAREPGATTWKYQPLMISVQIFMLSFLIFPALATLQKSKWGTR